MKKELLLSVLFASVSLVTSFESLAQQAQTGEPAEELRAAAAAAAAPGALPLSVGEIAATPPPPEAMSEPLASEAEVLPAPVSAPPREEIRSVAPVVSTWNNAKASAVVLHPTQLRSRPVVSGPGETIDAETRVRLESSTSNADGTWWFVTAPGIGGGWLLESEMGSPQR